MIIKGKQVKQKQHRPEQPDSGYPSEYNETDWAEPSLANDTEHPMPEAAEAAQALWNQMDFEMGLVPDRRSTERDERRRSYRRVEEKQLISKAQEEAQEIRELARAEGFESGLTESQEQLAELQEILTSCLNAKDEALERFADDIVRLAIEVAEKIIKTEVHCDDTLVLEMVRDTVEKLGKNQKNMIIKVHPDQVNLVKKELTDLLPESFRKVEMMVMAEDTVDYGSCIVETNSGMVDANFSTQLEILKHLLGLSGGTH